jgi:hypothetical protein
MIHGTVERPRAAAHVPKRPGSELDKPGQMRPASPRESPPRSPTRFSRAAAEAIDRSFTDHLP